MKSMKKTLSVILAAVMLFAVCSMSVSAAVPDGNVIALGLKTTEASYKAGDVVTFVVSLEETADFYTNHGGLNVGEFEIAYDSSVFEPIADLSANTTLASQGVSVAGYSVAGGVDTANSSVSAGMMGVDVANNWDSVLHITLVENGTATMDARYIDCSKGAVDTFSFQLKVKADATDGTYKVGHNKTGYDNFSAYVISGNDAYPSHGWYVFEEATVNCTPIYSFGTCDVTVGEGGSTGPVEPTEPTVAVKNLDPKVQWRAAGSSDLYIGFEGELSGFTKDQAATVIASISEIGIEFSSTDATLATSIKATTNVVYDFTAGDAGVYKFRAIVRKAMTDADAAGTITHNLYARAFVKIGDKAPITASDIISTTIYDEYTEGVAGGLATLAANLG